MRSTALIAAILVGAGLTTPATTQAQSPKRPSVEFALLSSVNFIIRYNTDTWTCDTLYDYCWFDPDEGYTAATFPSVAPGIRITFWSISPLLIDAAMSYMRTRSDRGSITEQLMFEVGVGADLARHAGTEHPFAGVIAGAAVIDEQAAPYVGAQLGLRHFIRDYAALRFQLGYRVTLGRDGPDLRAIEVAAGIGFFL